MPPVGGASETFDLQGRRIAVRDGSCRTQEGALAGSAIGMAQAVTQLRAASGASAGAGAALRLW